MSSPAPDRTPDAAFPPEVTALAQSGKRIDAVKLLREHTGMGLREAKDAVDAIAAGVTPRLQPDAADTNGGLARVLQFGIIGVLLLVALYFFVPAFRSGQ